MKNLISIFFIISSLAFTGQLLAAGDKYGFKDLSGKASSLKDHIGKGKWKVAVLWASDCHVCNQEAEQYIQFHEEYKGKHIQVMGISLDGMKKLEAAKGFVKKHTVTFPNLIGEPDAVASMYENLSGAAWVGTPTIMVFNPKGELKAAQAGAIPTDIIEQFINSQSVANTK